MKKILLTLAAAGAMTLSAATGTYKVSVLENSLIDGKQVKAGDYKVETKDNNTVVLKQGKRTIELPARTESSAKKYSSTELQYTNNNDLQEIHIGGTSTKIVFGGSNAAVGGSE